VPSGELVSLILGPLGALALAVVVLGALVKAIAVLWKQHLAADADDRNQRDKALEIAHEQVAATNDVSDDVASLSAAVRVLATELSQIAKQVGGISREVQAIRKDMAARRRDDV
jgi:septal ring factor EnvC (AmiA/AmiB activator)